VILCGTKLAPLGKSGGSVELEIVPTVEKALLVEMIQNRGVDRGECLQTSHAPDPEHGTLSSSQWQMRVLDAIVEPVVGCLQIHRSEVSQGGTIRAVGDYLLRSTVAAHQFLRVQPEMS